MTFEEILKMLRAGKCESTAASLEQALADETAALAAVYKLRDKGKKAREDSKAFFAEDITNQLTDPVDVTSHRMLTLRRFPVVWAVAEVIRTNKLDKPGAQYVSEADKAYWTMRNALSESGFFITDDVDVELSELSQILAGHEGNKVDLKT